MSVLAAQLIDVANKCCSCSAILPMGGFWGWHVEGYRVGPFCNRCTDKPSVAYRVDDPSTQTPESDTPATDCHQSGVSTVCDESPVTQTVENGDTV